MPQSIPTTLKKVYKAEIKGFNDKDLILTHFISTEQEDRSKDIVHADGVRFDGVPVVLKQHGLDPDIGMEPIAKSLGLAVGTNSSGVKGIVATTQYYDGSSLVPPDNTGRRLYEKAKNGFMPYWSIGFRIEDGTPRPGGGIDIKRSLVYEYSQVAVPDNVGAEVIKSFEEGIVEIEKLSNDFITFGTKAEPVTQQQPQPQLLKSIANRINLELPMRSMFIIWDGFINELFSITAEKVTDLVIELSSLLEPFAKAAQAALNPMQENEKAIMLKSLLTNKGYSDADRTPSEDLSKSEVIQKPSVSNCDAISEKVIFNFSPVVPKEPSIVIDREKFTKLLQESVHSHLTVAVNKMRGKL